ncbi:Hsp70 family protein [Halobellus sp. GM3]|uniref:Hsp70 family protein n=1 Tax=Halobellus sp. GM3 TaxID=3458410 RepID=UPI00403DC147
MAGDHILGIDFGTRTSRAAVWSDGGTELVSGWIGEETVGSTVSHTDGNTIYVGGSPTEVAASYPDRTVESAARYLRDVGDDPLEFLRPQAFAAGVLRRLKGNAEEDLGGDVRGAVIAVPTLFNGRQRQAVRDAAEIAGFDDVSLIDETTAAAMARYRGDWDDRSVFVLDLGAGTLSTAALDLGGGVYEVVATDGDLDLGGDRWDDAIVDWVADDVLRVHGVDLREDTAAYHRLKGAAETAKRELSDRKETDVSVDLTGVDGSEANRIERTLTRAQFESSTRDLAEGIVDPIERTLEDAAYETHDIDEVLLVGGAAEMPQIRQRVSQFFGIGPRKRTAPGDTVARGAAIKGGIRSGHVDDAVDLAVTAQSLGIEVEDGAFETLIERNTTVPTESSKVFTTASDDQTTVQVRVLQGESDVAAENEPLDTFQLTGIRPAPGGAPQIEVTFRIDGDGLVEVEAEDGASGEGKSVNAEGGAGLFENEIQAHREKLPERVERIE